MPQYTDTQTTSTGVVVTGVLSTVANEITYTVTTPSGATATNTQSADISGDSTPNIRELFTQLQAQGFIGGPAEVGRALATVSNNVNADARQAAAVATATNTPIPDAPQPPPPVAAADNPNIATDTTTGTEVQNSFPPVSVDPNTDPNTNIGAEVQAAGPSAGQQTISIASDPNTNIGTDGQTVTSPSSVTENVFDPRQEVQESVFDPRQEVQESVFNPNSNNGNTGALSETRSTATNEDAKSFQKAKDWRVRLSLAPSAKYLYKTDAPSGPGILGPLAATNGVIFPYTPSISVVYAASYDASELVHSNYKIYNYKSSNVDTVTITGDFTAQDTNEANYLLAVIHFFKSVTKMFYGQDQNPRNGTPPPLVYMSGMGTFQFDNHPLAVTNFTYSLPNEVDYIRAGSVTTEPGLPTSGTTTPVNTDNASTARIQSSGLKPRTPNFQRQQATINSNATYVPTKMQIVITCIPIVTRNDISNNFSLRDYATGSLLQGSKRNGGGIW
jgi:hypothetical protein